MKITDIKAYSIESPVTDFSAPRDDTARASCGNGAKRKLLSLEAHPDRRAATHPWLLRGARRGLCCLRSVFSVVGEKGIVRSAYDHTEDSPAGFAGYWCFRKVVTRGGLGRTHSGTRRCDSLHARVLRRLAA